MWGVEALPYSYLTSTLYKGNWLGTEKLFDFVAYTKHFENTTNNAFDAVFECFGRS
jgi:hypothetical protein